jgi:hypothetical protein
LAEHKKYLSEFVEQGEQDGVINIIVKAQDKGTLETLVDQIIK